MIGHRQDVSRRLDNDYVPMLIVYVYPSHQSPSSPNHMIFLLLVPCRKNLIIRLTVAAWFDCIPCKNHLFIYLFIFPFNLYEISMWYCNKVYYTFSQLTLPRISFDIANWLNLDPTVHRNCTRKEKAIGKGSKPRDISQCRSAGSALLNYFRGLHRLQFIENIFRCFRCLSYVFWISFIRSLNHFLCPSFFPSFFTYFLPPSSTSASLLHGHITQH